jgi:hypothetical protein
MGYMPFHSFVQGGILGHFMNQMPFLVDAHGSILTEIPVGPRLPEIDLASHP